MDLLQRQRLLLFPVSAESAHAIVCMEWGTSSGCTETRKSMHLEKLFKFAFKISPFYDGTRPEGTTPHGTRRRGSPV